MILVPCRCPCSLCSLERNLNCSLTSNECVVTAITGQPSSTPDTFYCCRPAILNTCTILFVNSWLSTERRDSRMVNLLHVLHSLRLGRTVSLLDITMLSPLAPFDLKNLYYVNALTAPGPLMNNHITLIIRFNCTVTWLCNFSVIPIFDQINLIHPILPGPSLSDTRKN